MNEYNLDVNAEIASNAQQQVNTVRQKQAEKTNRDLFADVIKAAILLPESRSEILLKSTFQFKDFEQAGIYGVLRNAHLQGVPFNSPDILESISMYKDCIKTGDESLWEGSLYTLKNDALIEDLQQSIMHIFTDTNKYVKNGRIDPTLTAYDLNNRLEQTFLRMRDKSFSTVDNKLPEEIFSILNQIVDDSRNGITHEIQWGIPGLNNIVPLRNSEITIVGARSGHGKTAFVLSCILNQILNHDYKIGAYFGELTEERIYARMVAQYANESIGNPEHYKVTYNSIFNGFCNKDNNGEIDTTTFDAEAHNQFLSAMRYLTTTFSDKLFIKSGVIYLNDLLKNIRDLKQAHDISCYYVDYLQWVETEKGDKREKREKIEDVIRALNALSTELRMPIVPLSQLNRAAANNRPRSNHISGSDIPYNECDNMILLDMPVKDKGENYNPRGYEFRGIQAQFNDFYNSVVLNIAKQRDGAHMGEAFLFGFDASIAQVKREIELKVMTFEEKIRQEQNDVQ
jgi:replicative DNA helicase